jgi:hypothetical protein
MVEKKYLFVILSVQSSDAYHEFETFIMCVTKEQKNKKIIVLRPCAMPVSSYSTPI